ncbi:hypothetical protein D3C71_933230 [compost metagenome]
MQNFGQPISLVIVVGFVRQRQIELIADPGNQIHRPRSKPRIAFHAALKESIMVLAAKIQTFKGVLLICDPI